MLAWLVPFIALFAPNDSLLALKPVTELNQWKTQYFPQYNPNTQNIFFTVRKTAKSDEDLYMAHWNGISFDFPMPINELNQENNEGTPSISKDGETMVFSGCDYPQSFGGCDLFETHFSDGSWSRPKNMGFRINSHDWEGQPHLTASGDSLFFASDRPGGKGKRDIWLARKDGQGIWQFPLNLGDLINTSEDEQGPYTLPNRGIFLFSSNQKGGHGGLDFYQSLFTQGQFNRPKNLHMLNSVNHDAGISLGKSANAYYLSRTMEGNTHDLGIVHVIIPDSIWIKNLQTFEEIKFEDIQFESNAWNLPIQIPSSLLKLQSYLQQNPERTIRIEGHSDDLGQEAFNKTLSEKRALAIKLYLINVGIDAKRIQSDGFGTSRTKSKLNRTLNRRIEIKLD